MGRKGLILLAVCVAVALGVAAFFYLRNRQAAPTFGMFHPQMNHSEPAPTQTGGTQPVQDPTAGSVQNTPVAPKVVTYKVRRGDTLGAISHRFLGSTAKWRVIAKENGLRGSLIKPGMQLHITLVSAN